MGIARFLRQKLWDDPNYGDKNDQVSCPEIVIESVDRDLYGRLLAQAEAARAKFDGTKAVIDGLEFDWNYDEAAQILNVTCTRKPFYAGCGTVESRIRELVAKARTGI